MDKNVTTVLVFAGLTIIALKAQNARQRKQIAYLTDYAMKMEAWKGIVRKYIDETSHAIPEDFEFSEQLAVDVEFYDIVYKK